MLTFLHDKGMDRGQIIELLQKNLRDREISGVLGISRNSIAQIRQTSDEHSKE